MKPNTIGTQVFILGLGLAALTPALAGEFEYTMARSSMRGGANRSSGGGFELLSTIGDPGGTSQASDGFEMTSGFQIQTSPTDCDEDGSVNLSDFATFHTCLTGPGGSLSIECLCYDTDASGSVDLRDFARAQANHSGP